TAIAGKPAPTLVLRCLHRLLPNPKESILRLALSLPEPALYPCRQQPETFHPPLKPDPLAPANRGLRTKTKNY
ncbi:hypothetical protein, partial [Pseudomonas proteolytica]|uniref:hypothetical protein n=1 Tax=Pseudomonas proteolytica TaxID=219574 RepID=UPI001F3D98B9